jgi:hypothetical protein
MSNFLRWIILILFLAGALLYLNSAMFSAWVSGGPPTEYPEAYLQQAVRHFYYFVALASTGIWLSSPCERDLNSKSQKLFSFWLSCWFLAFVIPKLWSLC